jgi:SAM-dependent methyltransferase
MRVCRECKWYSHATERCTVPYERERMPLRNCAAAIELEYADMLRPGTSILEIGCGAWSAVCKRARDIGCHWEGIDISDHYQGKPTLATRVASVEAIPFPVRNFDYVVSTQSMEHWEEHRVDLRKGLSEMFRVVKPRGQVLVNVPIFYHGGHRFVRGDVNGVRKLFEAFSEDVVMEAWHSESGPGDRVRRPGRRQWSCDLTAGRSAYILDIRARCKADPPYFDVPPITTGRKIVEGLYYRGLFHYARIGAGRVLTLVFKRPKDALPHER